MLASMGCPIPSHLPSYIRAFCPPFHPTFQVINVLGTTVPFIIHSHCPKDTTWQTPWCDKVKVWYGGIQAKMWWKIKAAPKRQASDTVSLWKAWEQTLITWNWFKHKFEVRAGGGSLNGGLVEG